MLYEVITRDTERAKALLTEAGYPDGFTMKLVTSERGHYRVNYESLRDQLADVGVTVELEVVPHAEMHKRIREDENAIVIVITSYSIHYTKLYERVQPCMVPADSTIGALDGVTNAVVCEGDFVGKTVFRNNFV